MTRRPRDSSSYGVGWHWYYWYSRLSICGMLLLGRVVDSLSVAPRHVCLLHSYQDVRGPYFTALLDQLAEQAGHVDALKMVLCSDNPHDNIIDHAQQIQQDFGLSSCNTICLQDHNPISLWKELDQIDPNIIWVSGSSSHPWWLRYRLRTSGLDHWIYHHCGNTMANGKGCVYVGEGAGAIVAGASLRVANYRDVLMPATLSVSSETARPPEPQFFGLGLLGSDKTVAFTTLSMDEQARLQSTHVDLDSNRLQLLSNDQVYVWSQSSQVDSTSATSFVFLPNQRGMMEQLLSPEPLPPLIDDTNPIEGVPCWGEPSMDPSKQLQHTGDSEWFDS